MKKKKKTNHPPAMDDSSEVETIDSISKISSTRGDHNPFFSPTGKVDWKALYDYIRANQIPNNYIMSRAFYVPPIYNAHRYFPGAVMLPKVDRFKASYPQTYDRKVIDTLDDAFPKHETPFSPERKISDHPIKGCRERIYSYSYDRCKLYYDADPRYRKDKPDDPYYPVSTFDIQDPTGDELEKILLDLDNYYKASYAEATFDFFGDDLDAIFKFLTEHVTLPFPYTKTYYPSEYKDMVYLNDNRSYSKIYGKIYINKDRLYVRIEATLNRSYNKDKGMDNIFGRTLNFLSFDKYFRVYTFDKQLLLEHLFKIYRTSSLPLVQKYCNTFDLSSPTENEPLVDTINKLKTVRVKGKKLEKWSTYFTPLEFPMLNRNDFIPVKRKRG